MEGRLVKILFFVVLSLQGFAQTGTVVKVVDGDTFDLLVGKTKIRVRLFGIDCPERNQAYYAKAKEYTATLLAGKKIRIEKQSRDRYGRIVAHVYSDKGIYINAEIIKAGFAWHFTKYSKSVILDKCEKEARKNKRGLWADPHPVPPWEWRRRS